MLNNVRTKENTKFSKGNLIETQHIHGDKLKWVLDASVSCCFKNKTKNKTKNNVHCKSEI